MNHPQRSHRALLGLSLVGAFALLVGLGPVVASRLGDDAAEATEVSTDADSTTVSSSSSTTYLASSIGGAGLVIAFEPTTTSTSTTTSTTVAPTTSTTTSTTVAPTTTTTAPPPPPEPEPEPEPVAVAAPPSAGGYPRPELIPPDSYWDRMAVCETGGNWAHYPDGRWSGGLGIYEGTWDAWGGGEFASNAGYATREQQIIVANRIATQGYGSVAPVGYSGWGCVKTVGYP